MRLADLKAGDVVVRVGRTGSLGELRTIKNLTVIRMNKKSLTTEDGKRWDLSTRREVGDPGYGYSTEIEPFDANVHPFAADAARARELVRSIESEFRRSPTKNVAATVGLLKAVLDILRDP